MDKSSDSQSDFVRGGDGVVDPTDPIQLSSPSIVKEAARSESEGNTSGQIGIQHSEMKSDALPLEFQLENAKLKERNCMLELEVKKLNDELNKLRRIHQLSEQPSGSGIHTLDEPSSSVNQDMGKISNSELDFLRSGDGVVDSMDPIQFSRPPIVDVEGPGSDFVENEIPNASGGSGEIVIQGSFAHPEPLAPIGGLELNAASGRASMENIFLEPSIIDGLQRAGSAPDFHLLRQISSLYYNHLNSPYWDSVNAGINIWTDSSKVWKLRKFINGKFMPFHYVDWEPEVAPIFRELQVGDVEFFKIQNPETESENQVKRIVADLRPHITTLILNFDPFEVLRQRNNQLSEVLNSFPKLQKLIVKRPQGGGAIWITEELTMMLMDEFLSILSNLPTKPNIVLNVQLRHPNNALQNQLRHPYNAFVSKLYNQDNTQLVLWFYGVREFRYLHNNFSQMRVKFNGEIELVKRPGPIGLGGEDMEELMNLAQLTLEHGDQMEDLDLTLNFDYVPLEDEEKVRYQESLVQLSPFLTKLDASIDKIYGYGEFDIFTPGLIFPKLRGLQIYHKYSQPLLEVLNNCPTLEYLFVISNENYSFFTNSHKKSDEENLAEHFKNLTRLESVTLYGYAGEKFAAGGDLEIYLKTILPKSCELECTNV